MYSKAMIVKFACHFFLFLKVSDSPAQSIVQHLRWIMQKDLLGQDIFLIGPPGPLRRSVAMQYLVSTQFSSVPKSLNFDKGNDNVSEGEEFIKLSGLATLG